MSGTEKVVTGTERMFLKSLGRLLEFDRLAFHQLHKITCHEGPTVQSLAHGYELEYSLNDNIYLDCVYSTVAGAVRNSNKVSWRNILTADDLHMLTWLSVTVNTKAHSVDHFKMTTKSEVVQLKLVLFNHYCGNGL